MAAKKGSEHNLNSFGHEFQPVAYLGFHKGGHFKSAQCPLMFSQRGYPIFHIFSYGHGLMVDFSWPKGRSWPTGPP